MSVIDLITRVDAICKKYDKYDVDKHKDSSVPGDDTFARLYGVVEADTDAALQRLIHCLLVFARLYGVVEADTDAALQKSEAAATEKNRATAVAMSAEIRRTKARLLEELPKLQRLALKKVKGLSKEALEARNDLVLSLKERIEAVPDGSDTSGAKQTGGWTASASYTGIKINSTSGGIFDSESFQQTEESEKFREEYEIRRVKQDQGLDVIAEGLDTLKNMAHDMNEEMDRQAPLMDEIDDKVDRANTDLKGTNVRLKETVTKLRSSRNFCFDIILLCIILGIAAYLYNVLK